MCKTKDSKHRNWIEKVIWMSPRKNTGNIGEICIKRWSWMVIINVLHKWLYISLSLSSWSQALPRSYAKEWKKELRADVTNPLFSLWNQQHRKKILYFSNASILYSKWCYSAQIHRNENPLLFLWSSFDPKEALFYMQFLSIILSSTTGPVMLQVMAFWTLELVCVIFFLLCRLLSESHLFFADFSTLD